MTVGLDTMGKRIKNLREKLRLTQEEVANKIGLSQSAYNRYEKDQIHRFSEKTLERLAIALETTTDYILGQEANQGKLDHIPEQIREWLSNPECVPYVAKAFMMYQEDKLGAYLKK